MSIANVLKRVAAFGVPLVEITGGEPLFQTHCAALAEHLIAAGHTVLVETNGSLSIANLPEAVHRIMDLKCPSSGMADAMFWPNLSLLQSARDEVKFVIANREDYEWSCHAVHEHALSHRCRAVHFSPVSGQLDPAQLAEWILADRLPVRLHLQLHKIIWAPDRRGV